MAKILTPQKFDDLTLHQNNKRQSEIIWTAEAIGRYIGTSADFVTNTLAHLDGSPVSKVGRRYCAKRDELDLYFSTKPEQTL